MKQNAMVPHQPVVAEYNITKVVRKPSAADLVTVGVVHPGKPVMDAPVPQECRSRRAQYLAWANTLPAPARYLMHFIVSIGIGVVALVVLALLAVIFPHLAVIVVMTLISLIASVAVAALFGFIFLIFLMFGH